MINAAFGSSSLLPTMEQESAADALSAAHPRASVLVVDDAPEIRAVVTKILIRFGFEVEVAADGAEGWEAARRRNFDLVITDFVMPRMNGFELLRRLRAASPTLPVIVISGYSPWMDTDLAHLLKPGAFIDKPFMFQTLLDAIRGLLPDKVPALPTSYPKSVAPEEATGMVGQRPMAGAGRLQVSS